MIQHLVERYGYIGLFIGTFLEGETILVLAGVMAQRGFLTLPGVVIAAFLGSFSGDQLFFWIGKTHGQKFLERRPHWQRRVQRVKHWMGRAQTPFALGFRFLYGLRTVSPFALGMFQMSGWRFLILNFLGAAIWATAFGGGGYLFGHALDPMLENFHQYSAYVFLAAGLAAAAVLLIQLHRRRKEAEEADKAEESGGNPPGDPPQH